MKRLLAIMLSMMMLAGTVEAYDVMNLSEDGNEEVTFIVEVEGEPALAVSELRNEYELQKATEEILDNQAKVMSKIKKEVSKKAEKEFVYTALFNGFSINGKKSDLDEIKNLDGVKNVFISQKTPVYKPMLNHAGELSYIEYANDLGYSGKGQVIAVVDSFCDTGHEFFETAPDEPRYSKADIDKLLKTKTLNSGTTSANQVYKNAKIPYAFNYATGSADTFSADHYHGTHVTGIAAGKNGKLPDGTSFSGVAYDAQVLFMSAAKNDYLYDEYIFAAINDAALLGADVINCSFGSEYLDSASGKAYSDIIGNAKKQGISVMIAAGNSSRGYNDVTPRTENVDYSSVGLPAGVEASTAVAAADNKKMDVFYWGMSLKDGSKMDFYAAYDNSTFNELVSDDFVEYEYCGLGTKADFTGKSLSGKIALVERGDITFSEKANNAKAAGAIGIIIANTSNSIISMSPIPLPAAVVTNSDGKTLAAASEKQIKFSEYKNGTYLLANGGKISDFSSWGVDSSLRLKPEITAPGGNIYSAMPDNKYSYLNGTSMATPYMSGIYTVTKEYYETNPYVEAYNNLSGEKLVSLIENLAMNSAEIIRYDDGTPYSPRVQGAGLVNAENIINGKVLLTGESGKAKISLGEIGDSFDVSFTITNISNETVEFNKNSIELVADGYIEYDGEFYVGDSVRVNAESISMPETISVGAGESKVFTATVKPDKEFLSQNKEIFTSGFFVDGFVVLNGTSYASIPFTGFYGNWYNIPIFDSTVYDEGGSFLADSDEPYKTGTFLKACDDTGYYYIGRNSVDETIADKKYISFSNKMDLNLGIAFKNHRTSSSMAFLILDKAGNVRYSQGVRGLFNKYRLYTYKFTGANMTNLEEGEYIILAGAAANGSTEFNDTLQLPLVIDNTAPQLVSAAYNDEEKTVTVTMRDNHYLDFIYWYTNDDDTDFVGITDDDITADGLVKKTIDVSGFAEPEKLVIGVCDYAMNYAEESLAMLSGNVGVEAVKLTSENESIIAKSRVKNNTNTDINADVIIAFYDENMKLITTAVEEDCVVKSGEDVSVSYTISEDIQSASTVKMFVWEHNSLNPIDTAKSFGLL